MLLVLEMVFKMVLLLAGVLLQILQFVSATSPRTTTHIVVDSSSANCTNYTSSSFLPEAPDITYCELTDALRYARENGNNTEILLSHGTHKLKHAIQAFIFLANFALTGVKGNNSCPKVKCMNKTKLKFVDSGPIVLRNIELENCGAIDHDDSNVSGAIILERCWDVDITNLHIKESQVSGLAVVNPSKSIVIENCCFYGNVATNWSGGGLKVLLSNGTTNISLYIQNCNFTSNQAILGGGALFIQADGGIFNNIVRVNNCSFYCNKCNSTKTLAHRWPAGGGAVLVQFSAIRKGVSVNNSIEFKRNSFYNNSAKYGNGGAVAFKVAQHNNSIVLSDSNFSRNEAIFGSAIYIHSQYSITNGYFPNVTIQNCNIYHNRYIGPQGQGAVYISNQPTYIKERLHFSKNHGTALSIIRTQVNIVQSTELLFFSNKGRLGGAVALLKGATIMLYDNVSMNFTNNHANLKGGAIYVSDIFWDSLTCPIIHSNQDTPFLLHNNTAGTKNNFLHIPSNAMCPQEFFNLFCSPKNCSQEVETAPKTINITNNTWTVFPGQSKLVPVNLYDDYNNDVTNSSFMTMTSNDNTVILFNTRESITFLGKEDSNQNLTIRTAEPRIVTQPITVKFLRCPSGYYSKNNHCVCANSLIDKRRLVCNNEVNYTASLYYSWCMTPYNGTTAIVAGDCWPFIEPNQYFLDNYGFFELPKNTSSLEEYFCGQLHRESNVQNEGYGLKVLSYNKSCIKCNSSDLSFATQYIPLTTFLLIVVLFKISVNTCL